MYFFDLYSVAIYACDRRLKVAFPKILSNRTRRSSSRCSPALTISPMHSCFDTTQKKSLQSPKRLSIEKCFLKSATPKGSEKEKKEKKMSSKRAVAMSRTAYRLNGHV